MRLIHSSRDIFSISIPGSPSSSFPAILQTSVNKLSSPEPSRLGIKIGDQGRISMASQHNCGPHLPRLKAFFLTFPQTRDDSFTRIPSFPKFFFRPEKRGRFDSIGGQLSLKIYDGHRPLEDPGKTLRIRSVANDLVSTGSCGDGGQIRLGSLLRHEGKEGDQNNINGGT